MAHAYTPGLKVTQQRTHTVRRILPLPGKVAAGFRQGFNTTPEGKYGQVTWADWLRRRYGPGDGEEQVSKEVSPP